MGAVTIFSGNRHPRVGAECPLHTDVPSSSIIVTATHSHLRDARAHLRVSRYALSKFLATMPTDVIVDGPLSSTGECLKSVFATWKTKPGGSWSLGFCAVKSTP